MLMPLKPLIVGLCVSRFVGESKVLTELDTVEFTEVCVGAPTSSHLDVYDCFLLDVGDELYVRLVKYARA